MTKKTNNKTKKKPVKTSPLKSAKNFPTKPDKKEHACGYYQCFLEESKKGLTGNITKTARKCKENSAVVIKKRNQEIKNIMDGYRQIGVSLTKLLEY